VIQNIKTRKGGENNRKAAKQMYGKMDDMTENELSKIAVDCIFRVHSSLGPGLLESAYEECLFYELKKRKLDIERQKALPLVYEEVKLEAGYRIDLLLENKLK
jgi:hypothetical protein